MRRKILVGLVLASVGALLGACDQVQDARDKYSSVKEAAKALAASDLAPEKLEDFVNLAIEIEKDPSKAEKLLADQGISKEEFQKTMKSIQDNPKLAELFEQAKKAAAKQVTGE